MWEVPQETQPGACGLAPLPERGGHSPQRPKPPLPGPGPQVGEYERQEREGPESETPVLLNSRGNSGERLLEPLLISLPWLFWEERQRCGLLQEKANTWTRPFPV